MKAQHILQVQIISKTVQAILHSRIDVKKNQQKQFNKVMEEIKHHRSKAYGGSIYTFLNEIIIKQLYNVKSKLNKSNLHQQRISVVLNFYLIEKSTGRKIDAEHWEITFTKKQQEITQECSNMIINFIEELLLLLNRQPLFSEYYKHKYLRTYFMLDYQLKISQKPDCTHDSHLLSLPAKYQKIRASNTLEICLVCYYLPSLKQLCGKDIIYGEYADNTKKGSSGLIEEQQTSERKTSVYKFYDQQLDIVFISSDNQSFKNSEDVEQVKITNQQGQSQQFEMLFLDQDNKFIEDNKELFQRIQKAESTYWKY